MSISILDYGMGNLRSVARAIEEVGGTARIISAPEDVAAAGHLIVPGVGAFQDAIATLNERGLADAIRTHVQADRPTLGICLGLQLLFDVGYEDGEFAGLGIVPGKVVRFDVDRTQDLKVPHMGWNQLDFAQLDAPLFSGIDRGANVYFVHGYHVVPEDDSVIATTTDYGGAFVSSIGRGNLMATQFHPEKSQAVGLRILRNFTQL